MLKAKELMSSEIISVTENTSIPELASLLSTHKINGVLVMNDHDELIGVVTESDLIDQNKKIHIPTVLTLLDSFIYLERPGKMEEELKKMTGTVVKDIISKELITVQEDTPLDELATIMAEKKVHTLPVLSGKKLIGVIGKADIIKTIAQKK